MHVRFCNDSFLALNLIDTEEDRQFRKFCYILL